MNVVLNSGQCTFNNCGSLRRINLGILQVESKKIFEMECSKGIVTREECHKTTYGAVNEELTLLSELSEERQTVLKLRLGECGFSSICNYNEIRYFVKYDHLFANICCDLLKVHKRTIKKGLREISLEHLKKDKKFPVALVPGKSLCPTCYTKIFVLK
jgi:hypothetical protein